MMESPREGSGVLATGNPMIEMTTPVQPDADDDDEANDDDAVAASLRLLDSAGEAPEAGVAGVWRATADAFEYCYGGASYACALDAGRTTAFAAAGSARRWGIRWRCRVVALGA